MIGKKQQQFAFLCTVLKPFTKFKDLGTILTNVGQWNPPISLWQMVAWGGQCMFVRWPNPDSWLPIIKLRPPHEHWTPPLLFWSKNFIDSLLLQSSLSLTSPFNFWRATEGCREQLLRLSHSSPHDTFMLHSLYHEHCYVRHMQIKKGDWPNVLLCFSVIYHNWKPLVYWRRRVYWSSFPEATSGLKEVP